MSDLARLELMERCNFKPANQYWREKYEAEKKAREIAEEAASMINVAYAAGYYQAECGLPPHHRAVDALAELRKVMKA